FRVGDRRSSVADDQRCDGDRNTVAAAALDSEAANSAGTDGAVDKGCVDRTDTNHCRCDSCYRPAGKPRRALTYRPAPAAPGSNPAQAATKGFWCSSDTSASEAATIVHGVFHQTIARADMNSQQTAGTACDRQSRLVWPRPLADNGALLASGSYRAPQEPA